MRWRTVRVRLEGGGEYDGPGDFAPPVTSEHDALLAQLGARDVAWADSALISCLQGVRDGAVIEQIAVTDAWVEDDQTFCLIYTPPWADTLAGIRRQRGDLDPVVQLIDDKGQAELDDFRMSDDPQSFGLPYWTTSANPSAPSTTACGTTQTASVGGAPSAERFLGGDKRIRICRLARARSARTCQSPVLETWRVSVPRFDQIAS